MESKFDIDCTNIHVVADDIGKSFVQLALSFGTHDPDYVDAYFGPPELKNKLNLTLPDIISRAEDLMSQTKSMATNDNFDKARMKFLEKQFQALHTRARIVSGETITFDEETKLIYDTDVPRWNDSYFRDIQKNLENILPGSGSLSDRINKFTKNFIIPKDKVDKVFLTAIKEARGRTKERFDLPENENFVISYVTDKAWSGYNWFQGNAQSLIEVNVDLPIYIDRAIDLASHEGYPGHHVYQTLQEKHLFKEKQWMEFSLNALYSPSGFISEGSANYGIDVAFPRHERTEFERDQLCPLVGWNGDELEEYYKIGQYREGLKYAFIEIARRYLDKEQSRDEIFEWANANGLSTKERFEQSLRFIDKYRCYVINYSLGFDLVKEYVIAQGGTDSNPDKRWEIFYNLLSIPTVPSSLRKN